MGNSNGVSQNPSALMVTCLPLLQVLMTNLPSASLICSMVSSSMIHVTGQCGIPILIVTLDRIIGTAIVEPQLSLSTEKEASQNPSTLTTPAVAVSEFASHPD